MSGSLVGRCACGQESLALGRSQVVVDGRVHTILQCNAYLVDEAESEPDRGLDPLFVWWCEQAADEARKLIPKAREYGSYDLEMLGQLLSEMTGVEGTRGFDLEQGIVFYLAGKIARVVSAVRDGRVASDDTFVDIAIYARMVLYIREHNQWP